MNGSRACIKKTLPLLPRENIFISVGQNHLVAQAQHYERVLYLIWLAWVKIKIQNLRYGFF